MKGRHAKLLQSRWVAGVFCLLAYLGSGSGVLAEVCSLAATLDQSHQAMVGVHQNARVLLLRHSQDGNSGAVALSHRHGLIAGSLCLLANQNSSQKDHRLEFAPCSVTENPQSKPNVSTATARVTPAVGFTVPVSLVSAKAALLLPDQRPPALANSLLSTRVIVLLV